MPEIPLNLVLKINFLNIIKGAGPLHMSFSKRSNLKAKYTMHFKLYHQREKKIELSSPIKKISRNITFQIDVMHPKIKLKEKFKLKTKHDKTKI